MVEFIQNPRKAPRAPARCRAVLVSATGTFEAETEDVGGHGCQLVAPRLVRKGEPVQLEISHPRLKEPLRVSARVAWASERPPWRLGIAFDQAAHADTSRWFERLLAADPRLPQVRRIPDRIPVDATVYLAAPPRFLVDFTPEEVALLRAVGSGASIAELRARLRDRWAVAQRALFSLLAHQHLTLSRGSSVHPEAWKKLLAELEAALAVELLRAAPPADAPPPRPPEPPPARGRARAPASAPAAGPAWPVPPASGAPALTPSWPLAPAPAAPPAWPVAPQPQPQAAVPSWPAPAAHDPRAVPPPGWAPPPEEAADWGVGPVADDASWAGPGGWDPVEPVRGASARPPPGAPQPPPAAPGWPSAATQWPGTGAGWPAPPAAQGAPGWPAPAAGFPPPAPEWPGSAPSGDAGWSDTPPPLTGSYPMTQPAPRSIEAQGCFDRALAEIQAGRMVGGLALLRRALALAPGDPEIGAALAHASSRRG